MASQSNQTNYIFGPLLQNVCELTDYDLYKFFTDGHSIYNSQTHILWIPNITNEGELNGIMEAEIDELDFLNLEGKNNLIDYAFERIPAPGAFVEYQNQMRLVDVEYVIHEIRSSHDVTVYYVVQDAIDLSYRKMPARKRVTELYPDQYKGSPFEKLVMLHSRSKGAIFEDIVEEFMTANGHVVQHCSTSEYDRIIDGINVEIKGSTLWKDTNAFTWQQIREKEEWQAIIFLAVYYDRIEIYYDTRDHILSYPQLQPQHNGGKGEDTLWLQACMPNDFPTWQYLGKIDG